MLSFAYPKETISLRDILRIVEWGPLINCLHFAFDLVVAALNHVGNAQREGSYGSFLLLKVMIDLFLISIGNMKWIDLWQVQFSCRCQLIFFFLDLSCKLVLLLSQLFLNLEQWDLEQAVKSSLIELRHRPLDHNVNFLLFIRWLHFELCHHEAQFLLEEVLHFFVIEYTLDVTLC